jgi:hypothetical protein
VRCAAQLQAEAEPARGEAQAGERLDRREIRAESTDVVDDHVGVRL